MKRRSFILAGLAAALVPAFVKRWFTQRGWFKARLMAASRPIYPEVGFIIIKRAKPEPGWSDVGGIQGLDYEIVQFDEVSNKASTPAERGA